MKLRFLSVALLAAMFSTNIDAQQQLTKEQILNMSIEELSDLSLEDLMQAVETLGVSSVDELFNLIMNKNVSSASKKEESSFTSPLSSTVITRDEMRTYGISNIEEAFRLIPGMIVTEKTNGIYDIQMRGLNNIPDNNMFLYTENANTLLMIDGRPVQNNIMGSINFDFIPISIEDVERIEVVRGACSALYGANAVTGVINIITEKPNSGSKLVSGNLQLGSQNTYVGDIALRKAFNNKFAAGVSFNVQHRERPTKDLYIIPGQAGLYYCTNQQAMPDPNALVSTPYDYGNLGEDGVLSLIGVGSVQLDENKQPVLSTLKLEDGKTPEDFMTASSHFMSAYAQHQQIFGNIVSAGDGGYYSVSELDNFKQIYPEKYLKDVWKEKLSPEVYEAYMAQNPAAGEAIARYRLFDAKEPETLGKNMFQHPELARKQIAFNGYLSFTPASDIAINITAGYQNSLATTTPVGDDIFSFNVRTSKMWYAALDANIKGIHAAVGYMSGPNDYAIGVPGFKVKPNELNLTLDYDFNIGGLGIRPGITYQYYTYDDYVPEWTDKSKHTWHFEDPGYKYPARKYDNLSGFLLNDEGKLTTFAPSIRLDYKIGGVRLIGAFRTDKTNIPDKWHNSWQFAANYEINDNNFVRLVYGRANRGTNLVNSTADFKWTRTNMVYPRTLHFESNTDADFAKIDNFEIGYRVKPVKNVLIDAELFYSMSDGYGALTASTAAMQLQSDRLMNFVQLLSSVAAGGSTEGLDLTSVFETFAGIKYSRLPYEVKQLGVSFNIDYIISSKLLAKMNANFQKTTLDNYYVYSQTDDIRALLGMSRNQAFYDLSGGGDPTKGYGALIMAKMMSGMSVVDATTETFKDLFNEKRDCYEFGKTEITHDDSTTPKSNGVKHKATPSFYGMLGLIYKPIQQLEVSAFANFIGKRTYQTKYGADELGNRCTVNMKIGYKPIQDFEFFFNAHNLLNTKGREFTHCDEVGGIYSFGVNFGF